MAKTGLRVAEPEKLKRHLTENDAVMVGLGSMIGAGIFAAAAPAAKAAGSGLLLGLLLAGAMAGLNAVTMSQLASRHPESGGAYIYGRIYLGARWGFLAGWAFVIGKLASCTAMALAFSYHFFHLTQLQSKLIAAAAVLTLTAINTQGIRKTAAVTRLLVVTTLAVLALVVAAALTGGAAQLERVREGFEGIQVTGILQSAGLMFFAFAGYARVATLGEEIVDPKRSIPRAMAKALGLTFLVYFTVLLTTLLVVDTQVLAQSTAPLVSAVESGSWARFSPLVSFGACLASLGVLVSLMAGISRTVYAMAQKGDLPAFLGRVHGKSSVPVNAEFTVGLIVTGLVLASDLRLAIGFSSFAVLIYYTIANLSAWQLRSEDRFAPRWLSAAGAAACLSVALSLPLASVLAGLALLLTGLLVDQLRVKPA
jgi:APA family basic amino acid/polyamine antiporter